MNVLIMPAAKRDLKHLPRDAVALILRKLNESKESPLQHLQRLKGSRLWKLRVGDYRVIIAVDTGADSLNVLKVGHRRSIYKQ